MGGLTNSYMLESDGLMNKVCYAHVVLSIPCRVFLVYMLQLPLVLPPLPSSLSSPHYSISWLHPYVTTPECNSFLHLLPTMTTTTPPPSSSHIVCCRPVLYPHRRIQIEHRASFFPLRGILFLLLMTSYAVLFDVLYVSFVVLLLLSMLIKH
jgi:hypothetical protein